MSNDIFVLVEHHDGAISETTNELFGMARGLAEASGGAVVGCLLGSGASSLAEGLAADAVLSVQAPELAAFVPEAYAATLAALVAERDPRVLLIANTTVGMDVAGAVSGRTGRPLVAYCSAITVEGDTLVVTSQVYGGKLNAEVQTASGAIVSVVGGSAPAASGGSPTVETVAPPDLSGLRTTFVARVEAQSGDVDITGEEILVSVGRGIGGEDNIERAQELADALGATVSASRPVTDAGWLPKSRQVGKSGRKVKPKLYLACGISGAPEHLEGMSDAELIIAINTDEKAPIFDVAHYGATADLFDLLPALTDQVRAVST